MKKMILVTLFGFLPLADVSAQQHNHSHHSHAPGHCPACDFDTSKPSQPNMSEREVGSWYSDETNQRTTTSYSLGAVLVGGAGLWIAYLVGKQRRKNLSST